MTLRIIDSGFGRTGTMSTKMALEQLGLGPCHHMVEVLGSPTQPIGRRLPKGMRWTGPRCLQALSVKWIFRGPRSDRN